MKVYMKQRLIKIKWLLAGLTFGWMIAGCQVKQDSMGPLDQIIVFSDSLDWPVYKKEMMRIFSREYRMPVIEREYLLTYKPFEQFDKFRQYKNIVLIARLDSDMPVSKAVNALLNDSVQAGIRSGDYFYIPRHDHWARNQYVVLLAAPTREAFLERIVTFGEQVYQDLHKSYRTRLKERVFMNNRNDALQKYLANHFPFSMLMQKDYVVVDESLEECYVWMRRLYPDRSMTVHWMRYDDTMKIDEQWIIEKRNQLAQKIYHGDIVVPEETELKLTTFRQRPAYRLEGTWKNPQYLVGGPFRNITFIDRENKRVFMIDFYVQAIGKRKRMYLDQLDILAQTFESKSYLKSK